MKNLPITLSLASSIAVLVHGAPAGACSIGVPPSYLLSQGSTAPPPPVLIERVSVSLGQNFGGPGPGDCSELGHVEIQLRAQDGTTLDGRFGVVINVVRGHLPAALVDLSRWVAPIKDNKVTFILKDDEPSDDFAITVQAVNAIGVRGEESPASDGKVETDSAVGCGIGADTPKVPPAWLVIVSSGLVGARLRRRARQRPRATPRP